MAVAKVTLNGVTLMDVSSDTVEANTLLSGNTATKNDGTKVTGSYTPATPTYQSKTVTPTTSSQTITADTGYDGLSQVTVNAIPSNYIDTSSATATATDIVSGATAFVNGSLVTGSLVVNSYYEGSGTPSSSLGNDGDIYFDIS